MRVAQRQRVRGLVLVAPYYTDLGLDEVRRAGWVDRPWDWPRVRENAQRIAIFHSDADPYISQAELGELGKQLAAEVHVVPGAGHFGEQNEFRELTAYLLRVY
jgi:predicted alpha/beta hydrolase family esterase